MSDPIKAMEQTEEQVKANYQPPQLVQLDDLMIAEGIRIICDLGSSYIQD
jgi:hypothetical protein